MGTSFYCQIFVLFFMVTLYRLTSCFLIMHLNSCPKYNKSIVKYCYNTYSTFLLFYILKNVCSILLRLFHTQSPIYTLNRSRGFSEISLNYVLDIIINYNNNHKLFSFFLKFFKSLNN